MRYVFLVGCPRSGTTWLQMLLAQHPAIATTQETHLFSSYFAPLQKRWAHDRTTPRGIGLPAAVTAEAFDTLCTDFATAVLDGIAASDPATAVVLEKTPAHVRHLALIRRLLPQAYFIHLVRDPRPVAVSLTAAGCSWGKRWASGQLSRKRASVAIRRGRRPAREPVHFALARDLLRRPVRRWRTGGAL